MRSIWSNSRFDTGYHRRTKISRNETGKLFRFVHPTNSYGKDWISSETPLIVDLKVPRSSWGGAAC